MTTIQDIADRLGISKGTVSKALHDVSHLKSLGHTGIGFLAIHRFGC